jgi:hypothetical protein
MDPVEARPTGLSPRYRFVNLVLLILGYVVTLPFVVTCVMFESSPQVVTFNNWWLLPPLVWLVGLVGGLIFRGRARLAIIWARSCVIAVATVASALMVIWLTSSVARYMA